MSLAIHQKLVDGTDLLLSCLRLKWIFNGLIEIQKCILEPKP